MVTSKALVLVYVIKMSPSVSSKGVKIKNNLKYKKNKTSKNKLYKSWNSGSVQHCVDGIWSCVIINFKIRSKSCLENTERSTPTRWITLTIKNACPACKDSHFNSHPSVLILPFTTRLKSFYWWIPCVYESVYTL